MFASDSDPSDAAGIAITETLTQAIRVLSDGGSSGAALGRLVQGIQRACAPVAIAVVSFQRFDSSAGLGEDARAALTAAVLADPDRFASPGVAGAPAFEIEGLGAARWWPITVNGATRGAVIGIGSTHALESRRVRAALQGTASVVGLAFGVGHDPVAGESRARRLESIARLAAGVAHEVNNPVQSILAFSELAELELSGMGGAGAEAAIAHMGEVRAEARRVADIVRALLDMTREDPGPPLPITLRPIVDAIVAVVQPELRRAQVQTFIDVPSGLPRVRARASDLQEILLTLITNASEALQALEPNARHLRIIARVVGVEAQMKIRLSVVDDGPGFGGHDPRALFDPFFTTKDRTRHRGIGLSIAQEIAVALGGRLWAERATDETRFHLEVRAQISRVQAIRPG